MIDEVSIEWVRQNTGRVLQKRYNCGRKPGGPHTIRYGIDGFVHDDHELPPNMSHGFSPQRWVRLTRLDDNSKAEPMGMLVFRTRHALGWMLRGYQVV